MKEVGIDQETVEIYYEYKRSALHASQGQRGLAVVTNPSIAAGGMERYCWSLLGKSKCD